MKAPGIIGIALIVLGLAVFTYSTTGKGIEFGFIQMAMESEQTAPLPPVVGAGALIGGFMLLLQGRNNAGQPRS
jgi:hypothetical protein